MHLKHEVGDHAVELASLVVEGLSVHLANAWWIHSAIQAICTAYGAILLTLLASAQGTEILGGLRDLQKN